jgi:sarcosine oxidase subunit alpha
MMAASGGRRIRPARHSCWKPAPGWAAASITASGLIATKNFTNGPGELAAQVEKAQYPRFTHTAMVGAYNNNLITAFPGGDSQDPFDERYIEIRAQSVVVATGCIERPLLFDHNEKPGVMQVGCAHRLARTYGILPGKAAVFSVGHDLGLEAAVDLFDLGLKIRCVADFREDGQDQLLLAALAERRIPVLKGWVAAKAHGGQQVKAVTADHVEGTVRRRVTCDLLVASAGLTPVNGPLTLAQAKLAYDFHTGYFLPTDLPAENVRRRSHDRSQPPLAIEASGRYAGLQAAAACGAGNPRRHA